MRLLLIRHGESVANAEGRLQGHLDVLLSDRGRRQAERLAEKLAPLGVEALYTSPCGAPPRRQRSSAQGSACPSRSARR